MQLTGTGCEHACNRSDVKSALKPGPPCSSNHKVHTNKITDNKVHITDPRSGDQWKLPSLCSQALLFLFLVFLSADILMSKEFVETQSRNGNKENTQQKIDLRKEKVRPLFLMLVVISFFVPPTNVV